MLSKTLGLFLHTDNRRPRLILGLVAAVILFSVAGAIPAAAQSLPMHAVDARSPAFRTMDPLTGKTLTKVNITIANQPLVVVDGAQGLALNRTTGKLFAILTLAAQPGRELVTIDPATAVATPVGNTGHLIAAITFDDTGTLWAVSGDGDANPETLFKLSTTTGAATLVVALGNGADGEALAFNPKTKLLYHMSGFSQPVFETIDPANPLTAPVNIPVTVDTIGEATSIEFWSGDMFLVSDLSDNFFILKKNGEARFLSTADFSQVKGTAFAGTPPVCPPTAQLYGAANRGPDGPSLFYALNAASGAATLIGPIGFERVSGIAFQASGVLFATGERQDGTNTDVLLKINPCTGLGTEVGPTNLAGIGETNITDISFRPSDGVLFGFAESADDPVTINTTTGTATLVGDGLVSSFGGAIAFDANKVLFHDDGDEFRTINQTTGESVFLIDPVYDPSLTVSPHHNAWDFDPASGTLFGSLVNDFNPNDQHFLSTVNLTTGNVTIVGKTQKGLDAIAFNSQIADLAITKTVSPTTPLVNTTTTYTVTVKNNGPSAATNVIVVDTLPLASVFTVTSVTPSQGSCTGTTVRTCNLGTIASGASATITIVGTPTATGASNLVNKVTVTSDQFDPNTANNTATRTSSVQTITVTVAPTSTTVRPGTNAIYEVVVRGSLTSAPNVDVALTCVSITGPVNITCSFSPTPINPSTVGGAAGSVLTVSTGSSTSTASLGLPPNSQPAAPLYAVWLGLPGLALLGMASFSGRRKRLALALAFGLLLVSLLPLAGCNSEQQAAPPSTVTFKVQATTGTITVTSATITVLVDSR